MGGGVETSQRNTLIVLLILAAAIMAVVFWGVLKDDDSGRKKYGKGDAARFDAPLFLKSGESWIKGLGPKLKLPPYEFAVNSMQTVRIQVPRDDSDDGPRKGTFHLGAGQRGAILYDDANPEPKAPKDLKSQPVQFPAGDDEPTRKRSDPMAGSIIASKYGGTLALICLPGPRCRFTLEKP